MKTQLEFYMEEIEKRIRRIHELVNHGLSMAMDAFASLDGKEVVMVKQNSHEIEDLSEKVEDNVFETIARRQPVARDLRKLAAYLQISHHLYRIGRYACKIAHIVDLCLAENLIHYKELQSLPHLKQLAQETINIAMEAVLDGNLERIPDLENLESESDRETEEMFQEISEFLRKQDGIEKMSMFYVIVGRYFERAADHGLQIAERGIYIHTGKKKQLGIAFKDKGMLGPH
ncbi:MAG: hypothetical protein JW779_11530 [Candidatus Thorarchaeota archaeon]|nr:hypothetical protein [Candidatus Thorarchaeota archaeon]